MIRATIIALIVLVGIGSAAPPIIIPVASRKFDHDRHANAARAGGKTAACADCHRFDAQGAMVKGKEHKRCEACHSYPASCGTLKQAGPKGPARVCEVCHVAKRRECLPDDLPPPPKERSFAARFTHGQHLAFGSGIEAGCASCHPGQAAAAPPKGKGEAHRLCSSCHSATGVASKRPISDCDSCHGPVIPQTGGSAPADPFALAGFDHQNHHRASQRAAGCVACHDKLVGRGATAIPHPTMLGCQKQCHDGQKAFSAVGTQCTKCHKGSEPAAPVKLDLPFSHATHGNRNVKIAECSTCHGVKAGGALTPPLAGKDHLPCALSGCHQTEFASRTTKICGVCHDAVAPWQKAVSRSRPPAKPEWFESIDHASHIAKLGAGNEACTSCHGNRLSGAPPPGGHDGCVGCHDKQRPLMSECGSCHLKEAPQQRIASPWSVAAQFAKVNGHATHAIDSRTRQPAKCLDCHAGVQSARTLAQIKPATMAQCDAACHNGKVAFKTTGFGCARCHSKPAPVAMVTP